MTRKAWLLAMVFLLPGTGEPNSGGIQGRSTIGCGGGGCHGTAASSTATTTISAPGTVAPEGSASITVTVTDPTVPTTGINQGGFNMKSSAGAFTAVAGVQTFGSAKSEVGHTVAGNDQRSWTVPWSAASAPFCSFKFDAAGNAVNGDGVPSALDHWNLSTATINVNTSGDTAPPAQAIVQPAAGSIYFNDAQAGSSPGPTIVIGQLTIKVSATDDRGIDSVEIFDTDLGGQQSLGKATYNASTKQYTRVWQAGLELPGPHTLTARAVDCTGKTTETAVEVFVL